MLGLETESSLRVLTDAFPAARRCRSASRDHEGERVAGLEKVRLGIEAVGQSEHFDPSEVGLDGPVLGHAVAGVELPLADKVVTGVGDHFDGEGRRALEVRFSDPVKLGVDDVQEIRLHGDVVGQDHVVGCKEHLPTTMFLDVAGDDQVEAPEDDLVAGLGRW